jgi:hypothetical protein
VRWWKGEFGLSGLVGAVVCGEIFGGCLGRRCGAVSEEVKWKVGNVCYTREAAPR